MLIECILRRPGGTFVELDGVLYHFKPSAEDDRHICDVENFNHVQIFLGIPEGYRAVDPSTVKPSMVPTKEAAQIEQAQTLAPVEDGQAADKQDEPVSDDDREYWAAQYEARFGRKPHHKWRVERIKAELEA